MPADPRKRRRCTLTVAVCLTVTVLVFSAARGDSADAIARSRALEADGRIDVAVEHLRAVLTNDSRDADPAVILELARLTRDASEVLALTDEVLETTRDAELRSRAHMMRGDYLYAAGRHERAAIEYAAASERELPEHPELRHAASLLATGDVDGAIEIYDALIARDAGDASLWAAIGRGRALTIGGDPNEAGDELEALARDLAGHPLGAHAMVAAAEAREAAGELLRTRDLLQRIAEEYPESFEGVIAARRVAVLDARLQALVDPTTSADTLSRGERPPSEGSPVSTNASSEGG